MKIDSAAGQEAWRLSNGETELALTVNGGHMAPVKFFADTDTPVEPYYMSPWQEEGRIRADRWFGGTHFSQRRFLLYALRRG